MHIGKLIRQKLDDRRQSVTWFATQIYCSRSNCYKIFNNHDIDTELLHRICKVLDHDFFKDISRELHRSKLPTPNRCIKTNDKCVAETESTFIE